MILSTDAGQMRTNVSKCKRTEIIKACSQTKMELNQKSTARKSQYLEIKQQISKNIWIKEKVSRETKYFELNESNTSKCVSQSKGSAQKFIALNAYVRKEKGIKFKIQLEKEEQIKTKKKKDQNRNL